MALEQSCSRQIASQDLLCLPVICAIGSPAFKSVIRVPNSQIGLVWSALVCSHLYGEGLLAACLSHKLNDHQLSAVRVLLIQFINIYPYLEAAASQFVKMKGMS
jgi:hypothetical protein